MSGQLYVLSGPSGVGKSTIIRRLRKRLPGLGYAVSHTSRKPRAKEVNGVNYHFVERDAFEKMIEQGAFVEWAEVYNDLYGTSYESLERQRDQGLDVLLDLDTQGARDIKRRFAESVLIYVLPPTLGELEKRLRNRALDDEAVIEARLQKARREIKECVDYDYIVFNDDLDRAVQEVASIIVAERSRTSRRLGQVKETFDITI